MVGRYPKGYKFKGQHPWCICQAVPVMLESEEYIDYLLTGVVPEDKIIKTVPQSAIDFVNAKEANKNQWFVKENSQYFGTQEVPSKKNEFVPSKTIQEAQSFAKKLGFKNIDFGNANIEQANVILEAFHDEVALSGKNISVDKLLVSDTIKGSRTGIIGGQYYSKTQFKESILELNLENFKTNTYQKLVPFENQIKNIENKIVSSEKTIEAYQSKMGRSKAGDRMLQKEIKYEKSRILDYKSSINKIEFSIKNGEKPIPSTISDLFEKTNDQVKAIVHHEYGHHIDYVMGERSFKDFVPVSKYGSTNRAETFAEWYSRYRTMGENGIPDEILNIFKEWERMN